MTESPLGKCQWLANCNEPAVTLHRHPVWERVPCCQKHLDWLKSPAMARPRWYASPVDDGVA